MTHVCLLVGLSVRLSIYLSDRLRLFVCLSNRLCLSVSVCLDVSVGIGKRGAGGICRHRFGTLVHVLAKCETSYVHTYAHSHISP